MNFSSLHRWIAAVGLILFASSALAAADDLPALEGIFGLTDVGSTTALALWIPLDAGESVAGVRWFNSDGTVVFPEFLAIAGEPGHPELLDLALPVGWNISGNSLNWSEYAFQQPLASSASGIYLILRLPENSSYVEPGDGGGAGFGFIAGNGENRCWLTSDGSEWQALTVPHQAAVQAMMNLDKSGEALVLNPPSEGQTEPKADFDPALPESRFQASAFPNPFNPTTTIRFRTTVSGVVTAAVFDLRGHLVARLLDESLSAGDHDVTWNGLTTTNRSAPSGLYFVRIVQAGAEESISITLTK